jgi:hypothetical protein
MNQSHDAQHRHLKEGRAIHKDWRVWTAVILILVAMAVYVLTDNERLTPAPPNPQAAPAGQSQ